MNFYDRYVELCNARGKSPSAVAIEIGLAKPTVNRWKNGSLPTDATLARIASYFGVSIAFLMGKEDKQKNSVTENGNGIPKERADFINYVLQMPDEKFEKLKNLLQIVETM